MLSAKGFIETKQIAPPMPPAQPQQLVPHDVVAEEALLGALLLDPAMFLEVGYLDPTDFYLTNHGHLYEESRLINP